MPLMDSSHIRGIVFDLDGTLYVCDAFADLTQDVATGYIADLRGISCQEACLLMEETRQRLSRESGTLQTLSAVCVGLGGSLRDMHRAFEEKLRPEEWLVRDERVIRLLERLSGHFSLSVYTNNNRFLADRIIRCLGLDGMFRNVWAVEDAGWRPKPDEEMLTRVLSEAGLTPAGALFVGDRYDVDLRLPEQHGCPVYLSRTLEQLLRLEELLPDSPNDRLPPR